MQNSTNKKYIFICTGSDCKKAGSKKMTKELSKYLKEEKLRSSVRIIKTKCMDQCKKAPNAIADNQVYHKTSIEELKSII
ncbi:MAG: (2Fe-2S) ferredoxin domain-containing protein [Candidatus Cyclobacteriaceae bacterium M2_1C_046]